MSSLSLLLTSWELRKSEHFRTRESIVYGDIKKNGFYSSVRKYVIRTPETILYLLFKKKTNARSQKATYKLINADIVYNDGSHVYKKIVKENCTLADLKKWSEQ